jgi:beta-glucanase (GH16 family)
MLVSLIAVVAAQIPAGGYKLVWKDEFDYRGLPDQKRWLQEEGYLRNNEKQYYVKGRLENAYVKDGMLTIQARKDGYMGKEITSASLTTEGKFDFTYGYVEVRAKVPTGRGTWPAIWTLGSNIRSVSWPLCGEIDILENVGYDPEMVHFNAHTKAYNHSIGTNKSASIKIANFWEEFHVYGMEWTPTELKWFVDGKQVFSFKKEADDETKWPFYRSQYLILNLAIGGDWGGQKGVDDKIFPAKYLVDYVRIYQKAKGRG